MNKLVRLVFLIFLLTGLASNGYSYFDPSKEDSETKSRKHFNNWMAKMVDEEKEKLGGLAAYIPTSLAVAQAAHETGYGKSYQARRKNNFFGLYHSSGYKKRAMSFKSPKDSVKCYLNTLVNHRGYARFREALLQGVRNPFVLSKKIAKVYAENPRYHIQVVSIIRRDRLQAFDNDDGVV